MKDLVGRIEGGIQGLARSIPRRSGGSKHGEAFELPGGDSRPASPETATPPEEARAPLEVAPRQSEEAGGAVDVVA
jgi:hypothetical protein